MSSPRCADAPFDPGARARVHRQIFCAVQCSLQLRCTLNSFSRSGRQLICLCVGHLVVVYTLHLGPSSARRGCWPSKGHCSAYDSCRACYVGAAAGGQPADWAAGCGVHAAPGRQHRRGAGGRGRGDRRGGGRCAAGALRLARSHPLSTQESMPISFAHRARPQVRIMPDWTARDICKCCDMTALRTSNVCLLVGLLVTRQCSVSWGQERVPALCRARWWRRR